MDAFLKIKEIPGESQDSSHKGEFDLQHFSFSVSNTGTMSMGGGGGSSKATFHDIPIQTYVGKSTPELTLRAATGKHFPEAVIVVRKSGDKPLEYMRYTLTDCFITNYYMDPASDIPMDHWSLNYAKVKMEYQAQKADGTGEGWVAKEYNVKTNENG